jgi:hypothetical protein
MAQTGILWSVRKMFSKNNLVTGNLNDSFWKLSRVGIQ